MALFCTGEKWKKSKEATKRVVITSITLRCSKVNLLFEQFLAVRHCIDEEIFRKRKHLNKFAEFPVIRDAARTELCGLSNEKPDGGARLFPRTYGASNTAAADRNLSKKRFDSNGEKVRRLHVIIIKENITRVHWIRAVHFWDFIG